MDSPPPSPETRPVRELAVWKKLLFSMIVVVSVFAITELAMWAAGAETLLELEDPFRGFSGLVQVFERSGDRYQTRSASASTFNAQTFLSEKPENGLRIFCLGGSSSYGFPWGAEAAFTSIVGELIAENHPELHVEAINASGVSYAMHRLNIVADELLQYEPDVFVIYSGHNEFIEPVFMEALKGRNRIHTRVEYMAAHSRIYTGIWNAIHRPEPSPSKKHDVDTTVLREHGIFTSSEKEEVVAEFRWRLARLVRRAQAAGVRVVLATVPCNQRDWSPEASGTVAALPDADRRAWAEAFGVGKQQLQAKKLMEARVQLEKAVLLAPEHAESQYLLGKACDALGEWDDARNAYRLACDADASPIRRLSGINTASREVADEYGALLVDADRVFEEQSENGLVGFNLVKDYVHPTREGHELIAWHVWDAIEQSGWLGKNAAAKRDVYERVIANRPRVITTNNAVWFFNQGVLLEKQSELKGAIENYQEALRLRPTYVPAMCNLGALLAKTGRFSEAVSVLEQAVTMDPDEPGVHNNLAGALRSLGRLEEAIVHYELELQSKGPDQASVHRNLGMALQGLRRFDDAVKHYQEALRIEPDSSIAHAYWGSLLLAQGDEEQAVTHFEQAVQLDPDSADNYSNLGVALMRLRRFAESIQNYQRALQINPRNASTHNNLALAYAQSGQLPQAATHWREAMSLQPNLPGVSEKLRRAEEMLQQSESQAAPSKP